MDETDWRSADRYFSWIACWGRLGAETNCWYISFLQSCISSHLYPVCLWRDAPQLGRARVSVEIEIAAAAISEGLNLKTYLNGYFHFMIC